MKWQGEPEMLTEIEEGRSMTVELEISPEADNRPRQTGGFSMPVFRGRRADVQGFGLKARRPNLGRDFNPRSARALKCRVAPAIACRGA